MLEKIGEVKGSLMSGGMYPVYKDGDTYLIPPNSLVRFLEEILKIDLGEYDDSNIEELDGVTCEIEEHPEGRDRGGYVPTATFNNVRHYMIVAGQPNPANLWPGPASMIYDINLGEWQ